jgi:hypothetical protein
VNRVRASTSQRETARSLQLAAGSKRAVEKTGARGGDVGVQRLSLRAASCMLETPQRPFLASRVGSKVRPGLRAVSEQSVMKCASIRALAEGHLLRIDLT